MDKLQLVDKLKKKGFECQLEDHVPMIRTDDKTMTMNKLRVIVSDLGYDGSFGMRIGGAKFEKEESPENDSPENNGPEIDSLDEVDSEGESAEEMNSEEMNSEEKNSEKMNSEDMFSEEDDSGNENSETSGFFTESEDGQISFF